MKTESLDQLVVDHPHPFTSTTTPLPFDLNDVRHVRIRPRAYDDGAIDYALLAEVEGVGYAATSWTVESDGVAWIAPWRTSETLEDPSRLLHQEHARRLELV